MIKHVTLFKGNNKETWQVCYEKKRVTYTERNSFPNTVLNFILNSQSSETKITGTGTVTIFR